MKTNWTTVGKEYTKGKEKKFEKLFKSIDWQKIPCTLGAMPAMGIEEAILQLKIPKVSHVAVSNEMAPYGLYGIKGHYKQGEVDVFLLDLGDKVTVLASCPHFN